MGLKTINWIGGIFCGLLIAAIFGLCMASSAGASDKKSDKERIVALEAEVVALQKDLAGEHEWANDVNRGLKIMDDRTQDLNSRLQRVESRGPVAKR